MRVYRGEVYLVDFGKGFGSEQGGIRPAVIVQNNIGNKYSPTTIVVPVTSRQTKAHIPTHVRVKGACFSKRSLALTEQVVTIDKRRIIRKMGSIKLKSLFKIGTALVIGLGLNNNTFKKGLKK
ncbi:MAG: type II toxin-antitoxin system PemK/MazF family toxin [Ruminococcus sp.]|nr:type II toxin-antitoxin system PemK/MazF family toxin [Ruminococcus sp.]